MEKQPCPQLCVHVGVWLSFILRWEAAEISGFAIGAVPFPRETGDSSLLGNTTKTADPENTE